MNKFKYELTVSLFFVLSLIGLSIMVVEKDYLWIIPLWLMIRFNHMCLSLHHRLISHRSFETKNEFLKNLIIFLSIFQVNHSPLKFAIMHRHHHKNSDTEFDVHGPAVGFWNTILWEFNLEKKFKKLNMNLPRDLLKDRFLLTYDRHYYKILFLVSILIYFISFEFFWYVFVPASILWKVEANVLVNWYGHKYGYVNYNLDNDNSKNSNLIGYLTMGEGWHNNHHAQPGNYNFGHKDSEFDVTGMLIKKYFKK
jgi:fatty-acid desaturase